MDKKILEFCKEMKYNLDEFVERISSSFTEKRTDGTIDSKVIVDLNIKKEFVSLQKQLVEELIDKSKQRPEVSKNDETLSDECIKYIFSQLDEKGVEVNFDIFSDVVEEVDLLKFEMDADNNISILSKQDVDEKGYVIDKRFMDKDEKGNIKDTHLLDYIVNRYIFEVSKENHDNEIDKGQMIAYISEEKNESGKITKTKYTWNPQKEEYDKEILK